MDAMSGIATDSMDAQGHAAQDLLSGIKDVSAGLGENVASQERVAEAAGSAADAADGQTSALIGTADAAEHSSTTLDDLRTVLIQTGDSADDVKSAAELLGEALDNMNGPALNARDAARGLQEAFDAADKAIAENGKNLDINTEKGRNNNEALDGIATAAAKNAQAILDTGGSYEQFRNSLENSRQHLIDTAIAMGATEGRPRRSPTRSCRFRTRPRSRSRSPPSGR
jgi:hypothetical protein